MQRLGWALAFGVLVAGTTAQAQVSVGDVQASAGTEVYTSTASQVPDFTTGAGTGDHVSNGSGVYYNSYVDIGSRVITFESDDAGSGPYVNTSSYSTVAIDIHNPTGQAIGFESTITAAGFGFYLADTSGGCLYTGCAQIASDSGYSFNDLFSQNGGSTAFVAFDFTVSRAGESGNLFHLGGSLDMTRDGSIHIIDNLDGDGPNLPGARTFLDGFASATGKDGSEGAFYGDATGYGYAWDATDFSMYLGAQADQTLIYSTRVTSLSSAPCIADTGICLIAYSGFGDPVGRGGGILSFARASQPPRIAGLTFTPQVFYLPTFQDGVLGFHPATTGAVPEPATWISLIFGFGLLGASLRRRRAFAAI